MPDTRDEPRVRKYMRRTAIQAEKLPNGNYLITDETGSREVDGKKFEANHMQLGFK